MVLPSDAHRPPAPDWVRSMALASAVAMPIDLVIGPQIARMLADGVRASLFITVFHFAASLVAVVFAIVARRAGRGYARKGVWLPARIGLFAGLVMLSLLSFGTIAGILRH